MALNGTVAHAQNFFALDFQPNPSGNTFFGIAGTTDIVGNNRRAGQSPLLYQIVTDPNTNLSYYHMVLGARGSGFAQDVYIQAGSSFGSFQGGPSSASLGGQGNQSDPLNVTGATGREASGNPNRVVMRQTMSATDVSSEFLKDSFSNKPKITQDVTSAEMTAHVMLDMSNSDYSTMNVPGSFINTLTLTDGGTPFAPGSFDNATDGQNTHVTAGEYTYTPQAQTSCETHGTRKICNTTQIVGGAGGTYTYSEGAANLDANSTVDWTRFWDPSRSNPWISAANRP